MAKTEKNVSLPSRANISGMKAPTSTRPQARPTPTAPGRPQARTGTKGTKAEPASATITGMKGATPAARPQTRPQSRPSSSGPSSNDVAKGALPTRTSPTMGSKDDRATRDPFATVQAVNARRRAVAAAARARRNRG